MKPRNNISYEEVVRFLSYDAKTGIFTHIDASNRRTRNLIGKPAGTIMNGYLVIGVNKKRCFAHRLAWLYMTGFLPASEIDHINCIRSDNRWVNLREATHAQNNQNVVIQKNNTSGFKGVSWSNQKRRWRATITYENRHKHVGFFASKEDAAHAYYEAAQQFHKEFAKVYDL